MKQFHNDTTAAIATAISTSSGQRTNSADIQSTLTNTNRGNQKEDKVEGLLPTNTKEIPSAWRFHRCGFFVYRWTKFGSPKVDADLWRCWCIGKVHHKLLHG